MNELMSKLDQVMTQQRRFVADARISYARPWPASRRRQKLPCANATRKTVHNALQQIEASSTRLAHLVSQLLSWHASSRMPLIACSGERLDLAALAREVCSEWVPAALAKQIDLVSPARESDITSWAIRSCCANCWPISSTMPIRLHRCRWDGHGQCSWCRGPSRAKCRG